MAAIKKTFEFTAWIPDAEALPSWRERVTNEFNEFIEELIDAARNGEDDADAEAEQQPAEGAEAEQKPAE